MEQEKQQEIWALVELFGHQRIAGKLSKDDFGGALFRVDVPAVKGRSPLTKYFNEKAIYALTPVDEATALRMAQDIAPEPVSEFSIRREVERLSSARQLGGGDDEPDFEDPI